MGNTQKKFPFVLIWLFHVNRIETQTDHACLPLCWSWSGVWKKGANRIRDTDFGGWGSCCTQALRVQENFKQSLSVLFFCLFLKKQKGIVFKCTFLAWLLDFWDLPSPRKDTHRLMSRVGYSFDQWAVVSFVIKKLYVYIFLVKQCMYLVILMYFIQIYFHLLWYVNKFTDFVVFLNFLLTLHATWII